MKILSNKEYENLIEATKFTAYSDGKRDGYLKGYKNGKQEGYHQGLIADKTGVVMCASGVYIFKDGSIVEAVTDPVRQEEISANFK